MDPIARALGDQDLKDQISSVTAHLDPKVAVGAIIRMSDCGIVLCRRAIDPGYGRWVFPGGYVDRGEALEAAALREVRNAITPFLEKKREAKEIGAGLEAKVILTAEDPESAEILHRYEKELARVFVVSQVALETKTVEGMEAAEGLSAVLQKKFRLKVLVTKAEGSKCVRCWNYSSSLGRDPEHGALCPKCVEAVRETKS